MKRYSKQCAITRSLLLLGLVVSFALPRPSLAASVSLATAPLATSTTTTVKPNVFLMMDDSGSMGWDYMPDDVNSFSGNYGYASSQCNGIYYDPTITYSPPVYSTGTSYANATFTSAWNDGYNTGSGSTNLSSSFSTGGFSSQPAFYFTYSGTQTTNAQKNYYNTASTFYKECNSAVSTATISISGTSSTSVTSITVSGTTITSGATVATTSSTTLASSIASAITLTGYSATSSGSTVTIIGPAAAAGVTPVVNVSGGVVMTFTVTGFPTVASNPGAGVFTKVLVGASEQTNFANWYSYYRVRINMMKTATGLAFQPVGTNYRVGFATMNNNGGTDFINVNTFDAAQKLAWYNKLYATSAGSSTPLLGALADIGKMYAGKLPSKNGVTVVDPVQYSCQQNFTILSTDGFWNSQTGDTQLDGVTAVGNQDGTAARPMYDGAVTLSTWTNVYSRTSYSISTSRCSGSNKKLRTIPQTGTCTVTTAGAACTPGTWNNGTTTGSCGSGNTLPSPNPTASVLQTSTVSTSGGTSNTLSDVAMYYYQTDLRTSTLGNCTGAVAGENVCPNNVFTSPTDNNIQQHMTTFTLGLGARGRMVYSNSYLSDTTGSTTPPCDSAPDYVAVKLGCPAKSTVVPPVCSWQADGTTCNWPIPNVSGAPENIDDLWHAAVDGRGAYFSATNPSSLATSISSALAGINSRRGSAAAAATSTLNPVAGNNFAYVASYTTVKWKGNLEARGINVDTGVVNTNATWCEENVTADTCASPGAVVADTSGATTAYNCVTPNSVICTNGTLVGTDCYIPVATACTGLMPTMVADLSDTRTIYTANNAGTALINFDAVYATANPTNFAATHINGLSQWASLTLTQQAAATGVNLINFLRGQHGYENRSTNPVANWLYRYREAVLGDALESQPTFIGSPVFNYSYPGYSSYKTAQASRAGTVYMGMNDGMLHAFAADTGIERWAYVPSMVIPNMWILADLNYATLHQNFVNGSVVTSDVCTANCTDAVNAVWKTILVAGLNGGGRGYYALDITNPATPSLLWEFTTTSGIGASKDDDVGYGFGQPIITRKADGTWVVLVTSGYNNTSGTGTGGEFLFVLNPSTGAIMSKIATGVGSTTTPGGLAKISAWNGEPGGNLATYVYGGDLQGNVWRFDINNAAAAAIGTGSVMKFATLFSDAAGTLPQPITTTPVLAQILSKRIVIVGTGKYLETGDLTTTQTQSYYSIKDDDATVTLVNPRSAAAPNNLVQQTLIDDIATNTRTSSGSAPNWSTNRGCYADFPDTGERENIDSKLVQGIVLVPTIVPSNTTCAPGGYGWLNYFDYKTCGATAVKSDSTIVGVNVIYVQGKPIVSWVTSTDPTPHQPSIQPPFYPPVPGFQGKRVIWRELIPQ